MDATSPDEAQKSLVQAATEYNNASDGIAQWLAYMSTAKITNVTFEGECGPGFSLKEWPEEKSFSITVDTKDTEVIKAVSGYLKNMEVNTEPDIRPYPAGGINMAMNNGNMFQFVLTFSTGVKYSIFGTENNFMILSSDMPEYITYSCNPDTIKALRDYMAELKAAVKGPGIWG